MYQTLYVFCSIVLADNICTDIGRNVKLTHLKSHHHHSHLSKWGRHKMSSSIVHHSKSHYEPITVHCWIYTSLITCHLTRSSAIASSSCQSSCANRHSTWPGSRLPRRSLHSRGLIWQVISHFNVLIRCAMSVTLVRHLHSHSFYSHICFQTIHPCFLVRSSRYFTHLHKTPHLTDCR
jgi:hypothetical protein